MATTLVTRRHVWGPQHPQQVSLGSYPTYDDAQSVVDDLADKKFEVETTQIIGTQLRMVEQVTGRLTWPRALLSGAGSGAWFGLFVGLLISVLGDVGVARALVWGLSWGVLFGLSFSAVSYAFVVGRRDFTSLSAIVPTQFEVLVAGSHADRARALLDE